MSSVLQSIIEGVLEDVKARELPLKILRERVEAAPPLRGALNVLSANNTMKIIAEVKRSSPSKGRLATIASASELAREYEDGGASIVSVLTEERRFAGSIKDFVDVRNEITLPMLRKDFIVTEYQVLESRALGADLLLLIVAGLSRSQYVDYHQMARELGMDVLVEVHTEDELEKALEANPSIIGVNSRNLKTLELDPGMFARLIPLIPSSIVKVAESGISLREEVEHVQNLGASAVLVGETLVRAGDPRSAIGKLLGTL